MKLASRMQLAGLAALLAFGGAPVLADHHGKGGDKDHKKKEAVRKQPDHQQPGKKTPPGQTKAKPPGLMKPKPPGHPLAREAAPAWWTPGAWPGAPTWSAARSQDWRSERRSWLQRGGYKGAEIPPEIFRQHFGPGKPFRLVGRPALQQGYPRFVRHGHTFLIVDPWPAGWGENWYSVDDVVLIRSNGYYLVNRKHPGFPLAVLVVR